MFIDSIVIHACITMCNGLKLKKEIQIGNHHEFSTILWDERCTFPIWDNTALKSTIAD